jgi:hypothetical protein
MPTCVLGYFVTSKENNISCQLETLQYITEGSCEYRRKKARALLIEAQIVFEKQL